nr:MAG TPA: hypothetical protein [Caudoviricetes sp.]
MIESPNRLYADSGIFSQSDTKKAIDEMRM